MNSSGSVVLTGATGLLGTTFLSRLSGLPVTCWGRQELKLTHVRENIASARPQVLIHCAADTDVEGGEEAPMRAFATNALLPELLAQACKNSGTLMVSFSSTGCYGAAKTTPYWDYDALLPTTVHHRSKAAGEEAIRASGCDHLILRLGWLYGGKAGLRKNFVWARIMEGRSKSKLGSDPHQIGTPTFVGDVVEQTLVLLDAGLRGTFNCVAGGVASRFDYVQSILNIADINTKLTEKTFARKAPVSANESAVNIKLDMLGMNMMPQWKVGLARYIPALLAEMTANERLQST